MGEMAVVTGLQLRNASVVARTPVIACEFSERAFDHFIEGQGLKQDLLTAWERRGLMSALPQFCDLNTRVIDALCAATEEVRLKPGEGVALEDGDGPCWALLAAGTAKLDSKGSKLAPGAEFGSSRPYGKPSPTTLTGDTECTVLRFPAAAAAQLIRDIPQLSYALRKHRMKELGVKAPWLLSGNSNKRDGKH